MNIIAPSALKNLLLRIIFYNKEMDLKIICLISQKLNALLTDLIVLARMTIEEKLASYFLICCYGSWHVSLWYQAV